MQCSKTRPMPYRGKVMNAKQEKIKARWRVLGCPGWYDYFLSQDPRRGTFIYYQWTSAYDLTFEERVTLCEIYRRVGNLSDLLHLVQRFECWVVHWATGSTYYSDVVNYVQYEWEQILQLRDYLREEEGNDHDYVREAVVHLGE